MSGASGRLRGAAPVWVDAVKVVWTETAIAHLIDVPRLTYANWLAVRDDAWSEVIRIQCRYPDRYMPWTTADQLEKLLLS